MVVSECESTAQAREALARLAAQVVFLDVQMPKERPRTCPHAFGDVRAAYRHLRDGVRYLRGRCVRVARALYLLKPFDDDRLAQALARAEQMLTLRARAAYGQALRGYVDDSPDLASGAAPWLTRFSIRSVGRIESLQVREVRWISTAGNYVELHLDDRSVLHRVTISQLERRLDPAVFCVHRSAIVRRDECEALRIEGDSQSAAPEERRPRVGEQPLREGGPRRTGRSHRRPPHSLAPVAPAGPTAWRPARVASCRDLPP